METNSEGKNELSELYELKHLIIEIYCLLFTKKEKEKPWWIIKRVRKFLLC